VNIMMLLQMATEAFGDREAFHCEGESLTYGEFYTAVARATHLIQQSGCDNVALLCESGLVNPISLFACAWAGVPYVPLNYRLTEREIDALLSRIEPVCLLTDRDRPGTCHPRGQVISTEAFLAQLRQPLDAPAPWSMAPDDIAVSLFTSGTTGSPKAAILRQKHLVSYILGTGEFMSAATADAALNCVPPYHIAGVASLVSAVYAGRRVILLPAFSAESWFCASAEHGVTSAFLVPTMLTRVIEMVESGTAPQLPSLAAISYGGGKMPLSIIERAMEHFDSTDFTNAYGLTETSSTISLLTPADHREAYASEDIGIRRRLSSVGRALPGIDIEIRNDSGVCLGASEVGEVYVRGEQVAGEYADRGAVVDCDGWFATRDVGYMDSEGYLFLHGRADDVIVRGGENMSPGEIEEVLLAHPAVRDAAVVGIPDEQWGEAVAAAVVLRTGARVNPPELQDWVRQRLRSSRVPQTVLFKDELPYNETGKLIRRTVRAELGA